MKSLSPSGAESRDRTPWGGRGGGASREGGGHRGCRGRARGTAPVRPGQRPFTAGGRGPSGAFSDFQKCLARPLHLLVTTLRKEREFLEGRSGKPVKDFKQK